MTSFGVVYIHSGGIWKDICDLSASTLPAGTAVEIIRAEDHADSLQRRLSLAHNLPFRRTLYLDCDTVYCQPAFPEWVTTMPLKTGVAMSAWLTANQVWSWPADWRQYIVDVQAMQALPHWFRAPNAGLMLLEREAAYMMHEWLLAWNQLQTPLIEPAFIHRFQSCEQQFDFLPSCFHVPSQKVGADWLQPDKLYFVHSITHTENKRVEMERVLTYAG